MAAEQVEVVISGISLILPGSEDIEQLQDNLMNSEDLIDYDHTKWEKGLLDVPHPVGLTKFEYGDNQFFKIGNHLFVTTDPATIKCLKGSFEAICDSGYNPFDLEGSNTAAIMAPFFNETEQLYSTDKKLTLLGQNRAMISNRISFFLDLKGPSYSLECSSLGSFYALECAHQLIASGKCAAALVGSYSVTLGPELFYHLKALGKLNEDGKTKSFSANADGYTRSEGGVWFFLQRAQDAKRSYGTVMDICTREIGTRDATYADHEPSVYKTVLEKIYTKNNVDPKEVAYVEADGSASRKTDAMELNSLAEILCKNRTSPLPVGSIKSNIGHTEAASGLAAIVKALIALKTGIIPPNLNYSSPNPDVPALISGQMKVVTEPTPLEGNIVGVGNVNLVGGYGHVILKGNPKPSISSSKSDIPWLFLISGRRDDDLQKVINKVELMPFNEEQIILSHAVFQREIKGHTFRGFTLLNYCDDKLAKEQQRREIKQYLGEKRPVWFLFSGMGSQWIGMGTDLMVIPVFARSINRSHETLKKKGIDLLKIISSKDPRTFDSILNAFVGITAIQIALVDILKELGVEPEGIVGHSVGELGCAYADGCLSAEQTILAAYARGRASIEVDLIKGMMAAVGKGYNEIKDELPPNIEVACHNSAKSCTLSGPAEDMQQYITSLKEKGVFAKLVNVANIAYHSSYIKPAAPVNLKYLKEVITEPKERSKRWISSSIPESSWDSELARYCSAEYHTNNLLSSVLFEEASAHVPEEAIVIEIAPHGLLQSIVKESLKDCINVPLTSRYSKSNTLYLLRSIGKLYVEGLDMNIDKLYPTVEYPVPASTPPIAPMLTWDNYRGVEFIEHRRINNVHIRRHPEVYQQYLKLSIGDSRIISSTMLLVDVLETNDKDYLSKPVLIKDMRRHQLHIDGDSSSPVITQIQEGTGYFEVSLEWSTLLTASTKVVDLETMTISQPDVKELKEIQIEMNTDQIRQYLEEFYLVEDSTRFIKSISLNKNEFRARVQWTGRIADFLDAILMAYSLHETLLHNELRIVTYIEQAYIDFPKFDKAVNKELTVSYHGHTRELWCEGIRLNNLETTQWSIWPSLPKSQIKTSEFLPYYNSRSQEDQGSINDCLEMVYQNSFAYSQNAKLVIITDEDPTITASIQKFVESYSSNNVKRVEVITSPTERDLNKVHLLLNKTDSFVVINDWPFHDQVIEGLKRAKAGYLLLKNGTNLDKWNPIVPIMKLDDQKCTLYKACFNREGSALNFMNINENPNWRAKLTSRMPDKTYLVGRLHSLPEIYNVVRYCAALQNSELIRFIFWDDQAPSFNPNHEFYRKQIALDLVINLCFNNMWGTFKLLTPAPTSVISSELTNQTTVFPLSQIRSEDLTLSALGMNLTENPKSCYEKELRIFDYCGTNKSGRTMFGIGSLIDSHCLVEDELLMWEKPKTWSHEEAASVPVFYSMAYYILSLRMYVTKKSILVHCGGSMITQAIINVALSKGMEVYTTYRSTKEKRQIQKLYPQIDESNIFPNEEKHIEVLLLAKTSGGGVDIVVNTNCDPQMLSSSTRCIKRHGQIYHLRADILDNKTFIGTQFFLKDVSLSVLPVELLLELNPLEKQSIQQDLTNGLKSGHVRPLSTSKVASNHLNLDVISLMQNTTVEGDRKLVTLSEHSHESKKNVTSLYICSPKSAYIVISSENTLCFNIANLLLTKGARYIHILTESNSNSVPPKLVALKNKYPLAYINLLVNSSVTTTGSEMNKFLNNIRKVREISEIFIVGKDMEKKVCMVDSILRVTNSGCRMVTIGTGGESICESRHREGLPVLSISCDTNSLAPSQILQEFDRYLMAPTVILLEGERLSNKTESNIDVAHSYDRLPSGIPELLLLNSTSRPRACFEQVRSLSLKHSRDSVPLFLFPGLKPEELYKLSLNKFYPTFVARLPNNAGDIDAMANDLFQYLIGLDRQVYTLIANDWGSVLAMNLAQKLEASGKVPVLILLNSSPFTVRKWVSNILQNGDVDLINTYIKVPYQIIKKLYEMSDWEEMLTLSLKNSTEVLEDPENIRTALTLLRNCLLAVKNYKSGETKLKVKYIIFVNRKENLNEIGDLEQLSLKKPIIEVINADNHQAFLNHSELAREINRKIPYEYKTAARPYDPEIIGATIFTPQWVEASGLE